MSSIKKHFFAYLFLISWIFVVNLHADPSGDAATESTEIEGDAPPSPAPQPPAPQNDNSVADSSPQPPSHGATKGSKNMTDEIIDPNLLEKYIPTVATSVEHKKACKKYVGNCIAFYSLTYKVEAINDGGCKLIQSSASCDGKHMGDIEIADFKELVYGGSIQKPAAVSTKPRMSCDLFQKTQGGYFLTDVSVFLIEFDKAKVAATRKPNTKCAVMEFSDWWSFEKHRSLHPKYRVETGELKDWGDLVPLGPSMPVESLAEIKKQLDEGDQVVNKIKICKELAGNYASFLDQFYEVKKAKNGMTCTRSPVEIEQVLKKTSLGKVRELTSAEAIAIPRL